MSEIKPWQMIVIALAVLVLGYTGWSFISTDSIEQPSGIMTVDIMTGQLYDVRKGRAKGMALPARHPETNEPTLFPVERNEQGDWHIIERYAAGIDDELREESLLRGSGLKIEFSSASPIKHVLMP